MKVKILSLLLSVCLILSAIPMSAGAVAPADVQEITVEVVEDVTNKEANDTDGEIQAITEFEAETSLLYAVPDDYYCYVGLVVETDDIPSDATNIGVAVNGNLYLKKGDVAGGNYVVDVADLYTNKTYTAQPCYRVGDTDYFGKAFEFTTPKAYANLNMPYVGISGTNVAFTYSSFGIDVMGKDANGNWLKSTYATSGWRTVYSTTSNQIVHTKPEAKDVTDEVQAWLIPEITSDGNFVKIYYYLRNKTTSTVTDFKFGASADVQIGSNDYAPIKKTEYGLELTDGINSFALVFNEGYVEVPVDTYWFGYYNHASRNTFVQIDSDSLTGEDSGASYSWQNITLEPGEIKRFEVILGVGESSKLNNLLKPAAKIDYTQEALKGLTANGSYKVTLDSIVYDITADENGYLPLCGEDANGTAYDFIGKTIDIALVSGGETSDAQQVTIASRPDAVLPEYAKPDDTTPELPDDLDVTTTVSSVTINAASGQEYSIDGGTTWVTPTGGQVVFDGLEDGTDYEILTRVAATSTSFASVTESFNILTSKMVDEADVEISDANAVFDGTSKSISVSFEDATVSYSASLDGTYSSTCPSYTDVGTYNIYYKLEKDGYHDYYNVAQLVISKGQAQINVDTTTINVNYGDEVTLPVATSNFGTVVCDTDENSLVEVGTYTVKYTVADTSNYYGDEKTVTVVIGTGTVEKPEADDTVFTYNGEEQTYYVAENALYTATGNKRIDAGAQTVTVSLNDKDNYTWSDGTADDVTFTFTIGKKDISDAEITLGETLTYNGEEQTQTIESVVVDGLDVTYEVSDNTATDYNEEGYILTITATGNFEGTVEAYFEVEKATPEQNHEKLTTAKVSKKKALSKAKVTQGEFLGVDGVTVLEGEITWVSDTTEVITEDVTRVMLFIPADTNYAPVEFDVFVDCTTSGGFGGGGSTSVVSSYTVEFDTNGGNEISSVKVVENEKVIKPKNPEKEGFVFEGWFADASLTEEYNFDTKVKNDMTLYAKWTMIEEEEEEEEEPEEGEHRCPSLAFSDLDVTKWYHEDTDYVIGNGIFKGVTPTTFAPDANLTRAMLVTVLYRAEGEPAVNRSIPFADVDMGEYYANAVIWAKQNGIVMGVTVTEFAPNSYITREQIATILFRYAVYKGLTAITMEENLHFDDADKISEYAVTAMNWAVGTELIKGKSESMLCPADNATRAEVAAIIHRYLESTKPIIYEESAEQDEK